MLPPTLVQEVEALKRDFPDLEASEAEGWANLVFPTYPIPPGYSKSVSRLLVRPPLAYPNGNPDMFWVDEDLVLKGGGIPKNADAIETPLGSRWRRFSWHPQRWNPGIDSMRTYLEFVNCRLAKAV